MDMAYLALSVLYLLLLPLFIQEIISTIWGHKTYGNLIVEFKENGTMLWVNAFIFTFILGSSIVSGLQGEHKVYFIITSITFITVIISSILRAIKKTRIYENAITTQLHIILISDIIAYKWQSGNELEVSTLVLDAKIKLLMFKFHKKLIAIKIPRGDVERINELLSSKRI